MNRMPTLSGVIAMVIACAVVSGCASMAGVGGTSEYSCKAPEGVKCDSVSGTYYNSVENNLPSQRQGGRATPRNEAAPTRMEVLADGQRPAPSAYVTPELAPFATRAPGSDYLQRPIPPCHSARPPVCCAFG